VRSACPTCRGAPARCPTARTSTPTRSPGTTPVCPVLVGETLNTKLGNSGLTAQGLNIRITDWQTVDQIVNSNADGNTNTPPAQLLVVIPVPTNPAARACGPTAPAAR
jgi:hypothetical protein